MLIGLFFFDDPLYIIKWIFPFRLYNIFYAIGEATFIAMLLFFWLILVHSISANEVLNVDEKRFFLPKIIICGAIWITLLISFCYFSIK